jgi:hypothetical protein
VIKLESEEIKVNAVSPGFTKTNRNNDAGTETVEKGTTPVSNRLLRLIRRLFVKRTNKLRQPTMPKQLANCHDLAGVVPVVVDHPLHQVAVGVCDWPPLAHHMPLQRYHTGRYTISDTDGAAEWVRVAIEAEAIEPAMMLVFGLGSNCQVIEPPELKQAVVQRSRQMLDQMA